MRSTTRGLLLLVLLTACAGPTVEPVLRPDAVVVASFDFAESELIGEIYAQALEARGVDVHRQLRLGPRELVLPALRQGLVDVTPEYLGSAVAAAEQGTQADLADLATAGAVDLRRRLSAALRRDGLRVLQPAAARNVNAVAVTRSTAERLGLTRTSDLAEAAPTLSITGPPECPTRPLCLPGLRAAYGLSFREFVPYDSTRQRVTALKQGLVDVAVVFSTDGHLAGGEFVVLADDRRLQPADHVVPVVSDRAAEASGPELVQALEDVSRRLDSAALTFLNWRVEVAGGDVPAEARGWLLRHGLLSD